MDKAYYPDKFVVPFIEIVHDRVEKYALSEKLNALDNI